MIPYRDENRAGGFPAMTYALIAVNLFVFFKEAAAAAQGQAALEQFVTALGVIPYRITHHIQPPPPAPHPELLTLITSMFVHADWLHVLGNMLYLFIFGPSIEYLTGSLRFLLFYLACGLVAGMAQVVFYPDSTIVAIGASGAIAGVLGAYLLFFGRHTIDAVLPVGCLPLFLRVPAMLLIGLWILLQIYLVRTQTGASGGIGYLEHVVGFVAGMILIFVFKARRAPQPLEPEY